MFPRRVHKSSLEMHSNAGCELTLPDLIARDDAHVSLVCCTTFVMYVFVYFAASVFFRCTVLATNSTRAGKLKHTVIHTQFVTLTPSVWFI